MPNKEISDLEIVILSHFWPLSQFNEMLMLLKQMGMLAGGRGYTVVIRRRA